MSATTVRRVVIAVCGLGIAGVIVGSIADNTGFALTSGIVTAVAVLCLIVATSVEREQAAGADGQDAADREGQRVEELVHRLVAQGAPEEELRELVRAAVRLGRLR